MKNKKVLIVGGFCIFLLLVFVVLYFVFSKKDEMNFQEQNGLISKESYDVDYSIDSDFLHFVFFNKLDEPIQVEQILIKDGNTIVFHFAFPFTLQTGENRVDFPNEKHISSISSLSVLLYNVKESKPEEFAYRCSVMKDSTSSYQETHYYTFRFIDNIVKEDAVYREFKFFSREAYDDFVLEVEADSDFAEQIQVDEENLIQQFYFKTVYPVPNTVKTIDGYIDYLENTYGYSCEKSN